MSRRSIRLGLLCIGWIVLRSQPACEPATVRTDSGHSSRTDAGTSQDANPADTRAQDTTSPDASGLDAVAADTARDDSAVEPDAAAVDAGGPTVVWAGLGGSDSAGGISASTGRSQMPSLGQDSAGQLLVAWTDNSSGHPEVYAKAFDGAAWVELGSGSASGGGISATASDARAPRLGRDSAGRPLIAWTDDSAGNWEIYARVFDGAAWIELGTGSASGGGISANEGMSYDPSLGQDSGGRPIVAWGDDVSGNSEIYAKVFDGAAWVELGAGSASGGGISASEGYSGSPQMSSDPEGRPLITWYDYSPGNSEIYLKVFDGAAWVELGTGSASGGGISANAGFSASARLGRDSSDRPLIVWEDDTSGNREIYAKVFDGAAWVELGAGSAAAGGISANAGSSNFPSLAPDSDGRPLVVWRDDSSSHNQVYAKIFDGAAWREFGAGSAAGGGISNSEADAYTPSVVTYGDRICVAWPDGDLSTSEIFLRCASVE